MRPWGCKGDFPSVVPISPCASHSLAMALLYLLLSVFHAVLVTLASTTPNHTRFDVLDLVDPFIGTANGGTIRATRFYSTLGPG